MKNFKILFGAAVLMFLAGTVNAQTSVTNKNFNSRISLEQKLEQQEALLFEIDYMDALERQRKIKKTSGAAAPNQRPDRVWWIEGEKRPDELTEVEPDSK